MGYDGAPHQGQCEGCTTTAWHGQDAAYLDARGEAWEDEPEGRSDGRAACRSWRSDADGNATWGPPSRPVPHWTRPGATPVQTLGRHGHHH